MKQPLLRFGLTVRYNKAGDAGIYFGPNMLFAVRRRDGNKVAFFSPSRRIRQFLEEWAGTASKRSFVTVEGSVYALGVFLDQCDLNYWHCIVYTILVECFPNLKLTEVAYLIGLRETDSLCYLTDSNVLVMLDFRRGRAHIQIGNAEMKLEYDREPITHKNLAHVLMTYHYLMLGMRQVNATFAT